MDWLVANGAALLFYAFAATTLVGAVAVITLRNPMYSAFALLVSFISVSALFFLLHAEFVGVVQFFVYGGGIMVLFLFVIMLVNLHNLSSVSRFGSHWPFAAVVALSLALLIVLAVAGVQFAPANPSPEVFVDVEGEAMGNSQAVAWELYRGYLLPFEIASVFLLVAMIGAVVLGRRN